MTLRTLTLSGADGRPTTDCQPTLTFVGHSTALVEVGGLRILTDPVLADRVAFIRRVAPSVPEATSRDLDLVLVSHLHHDHLHIPSLRRLSRNVPVVVPKGAANVARRGTFDDIVEVVPGDKVTIGDVSITVVPALHRDQRGPFGRRAQPVGYIIENDDWSCYFAGDTDLFDDMRTFRSAIDVALIPVWGWGPTLGHGHLDPARAAIAVDLIRPSTVVPIHWGTLWPIGLSRYRADRLVAPPHEMAASLSRLGVETNVRMLSPGTSLHEAGPAN